MNILFLSCIRPIYLMVVLSSLLLVACDKKPTTPPPPAGPRLSAPGTVYVTKAFSVTTEHGIYGFVEGAQVSILNEEGNQYRVTDGKMEAKAPKTSFTNDLDVVDAILVKGLEQKSQAGKDANDGKSRKPALQESKNQNTSKVAKMTELESNIKTAETRIKLLRNELEMDAKRQADAVAKHLTPNRNQAENKARLELIASLNKKINDWRNEMANIH